MMLSILLKVSKHQKHKCFYQVATISVGYVINVGFMKRIINVYPVLICIIVALQ